MHLSLASSWPPCLCPESFRDFDAFIWHFSRSKLLMDHVAWIGSGCGGMLLFPCCLFPTLLPSLFSSSEQCCVQLLSCALTRSTLPAFLSSFNFWLFLFFCSHSLLTLLHWLILFMLCCPLPLIYFPLLFHYKLNPESPQPLHAPGISFTSCTGINKLPWTVWILPLHCLSSHSHFAIFLD